MKNNNQNISQKLLKSLSHELEEKSLICLIGANMSGKSTLIKRLRSKSSDITTEAIFALHINPTENEITFSSGDSGFRIDNISPFVSKIIEEIKNLDATLSTVDINNFYTQVIDNLNTYIQQRFDREIIISCKDNKEESRHTDIRIHIDRILKKLTAVNDVSEIDNTKVNEFRKNIENYAKDLIMVNDITPVNNYNQDEKKVFWINYHQTGDVKITQVSSGLESLIILLFIVEAVKYFETHSDKIKFWLIIDEPESYLHPKWQREFLSYLLDSINQNIKILFATHSQYMIPTNKLDCIGIVARSEEKRILYKNISDFIKDSSSSNNQVDKIKIKVLQPIEDALGFQFDIFKLPFLTVEGEEELGIFRKLQLEAKIKANNIFNLKGASNITPWLQASRIYEDFNGIFLLDADIDINEHIKNIDNKQSLIASLKDHFLFIGKSIHTFEDFYEKIEIDNDNEAENDDNCVDCKRKHYYKLKQEFNKYLIGECLEDFIAANIFETELAGYTHLVEIAKEVISEFSTHDYVKVKNPELALESFLAQEQKKFKDMVIRINSNITHQTNDKGLNDELHNKIKRRLKRKILDDTLNRDLHTIFSELIDKINHKLE